VCGNAIFASEVSSIHSFIFIGVTFLLLRVWFKQNEDGKKFIYVAFGVRECSPDRLEDRRFQMRRFSEGRRSFPNSCCIHQQRHSVEGLSISISSKQSDGWGIMMVNLCLLSVQPQPSIWKPCPLFRDADEVCCSLSAFNSLVMGKGSFSAFFSSCPACVNNLQTIWCNYGCRTDQDNYMWPTKLDPSNPQIIKEIAFNISLSYLTSVYQSCQDVSLPDGSKFPEMWGKTPIQFFEIMVCCFC
jgi:hypothetical protein